MDALASPIEQLRVGTSFLSLFFLWKDTLSECTVLSLANRRPASSEIYVLVEGKKDKITIALSQEHQSSRWLITLRNHLPVTETGRIVFIYDCQTA